MRLSTSQINGLIISLKPFLTMDDDATLYLYGSRVHDNLRGGDIDLLLLLNSMQRAEFLLDQKHVLLASIKKQLGDQKIDLKIATENELQEDSFLQLIAAERCLIHRFSGK